MIDFDKFLTVSGFELPQIVERVGPTMPLLALTLFCIVLMSVLVQNQTFSIPSIFYRKQCAQRNDDINCCEEDEKEGCRSFSIHSIFHRKQYAPKIDNIIRCEEENGAEPVRSTALPPISKRLQHTFSEEAIKGTIQWWENLAPPSIECQPNINATLIHFCFLMHGHRGLSRDLAYLQSQMKEQAIGILKKRTHQDIIVYASVCNERKTTDGIQLGGERLAEEMISVIRQHMKYRNTTNTTTITLSVLGNSLGGLYVRYAISKLEENFTKSIDDQDTLMLDGKFHIHWNVFCTTATPHLGLAGHTFLPIPRTAEIGLAHAMGQTGRDLFRLNDLIRDMATSNQFLKPLSFFRKRIAYANAYGTDFPVPAHTAAFLSSASEYPHHFESRANNDPDRSKENMDECELVVATLHTTPLEKLDEKEKDFQATPRGRDKADDSENDLVLMSSSLDALGWKKVFLDVRKETPKIPLPPIERLSPFIDSSNSSSDSDPCLSEKPSFAAMFEPPVVFCTPNNASIQHLRQRKVVSSKDVAAAVTKPMFESHQFHWPVGHNMMVAFSRSRLSSYLNRAGRPFVDSLAKEMVCDIFSFEPDATTVSMPAATLHAH